MRILVVSNLFPPYHGGGYGLLCYRCTEGLARLGHRVEVLTSQPRGEAAGSGDFPFPVRRELQFMAERCGPARLLTATLANRRATQRAIRDVRPDVVYCHGIDGVGFNVYDAATEAGIPSLTMVGDTWLSQCWRDLRKFDSWTDLASGGRARGPLSAIKGGVGVLGRTLRLATAARPRQFHPATCISTYLLRDLIAAGAPAEGKLCVIPPMLPHDYFSGSRPIGRAGGRCDYLRALFVGRLEPLKGMDTAITGLAAAVRRGADVRLTFAGLLSEKFRPLLDQLAAEHDVAGRIALAGTPSDRELPALYRQHDVFLFPSRIVEGFGMVNAEAMACGLPVIGTAEHGSADAIVHGETGLRIAPGDAESLGRHLHALWDDRDRLETMSQAAMNLSVRHRPELVVAQIGDCLRRVIDGRPLPAGELPEPAREPIPSATEAVIYS